MTKRRPVTESSPSTGGGEPAPADQGQRAPRSPRARARAPGPTPEMLKRLRLVTECRQSHGIRAAQEMWRKLDLPLVPAMGAQPAQSTMPFTFGDQGGK